MVQVTARQDARERMRQAQREEATALAAVTGAQAARDRLQRKVDAADDGVAQAIARLASTSGVERAAVLLDEPVALVRRLAQSAGTGPRVVDSSREPS